MRARGASCGNMRAGGDAPELECPTRRTLRFFDAFQKITSTSTITSSETIFGFDFSSKFSPANAANQSGKREFVNSSSKLRGRSLGAEHVCRSDGVVVVIVHDDSTVGPPLAPRFLRPGLPGVFSLKRIRRASQVEEVGARAVNRRWNHRVLSPRPPHRSDRRAPRPRERPRSFDELPFFLIDSQSSSALAGENFDEKSKPKMVSLDVIVDVEVIFWKASKKRSVGMYARRGIYVI